jgi:CheY-like chemotaxis protein
VQNARSNMQYSASNPSPSLPAASSLPLDQQVLALHAQLDEARRALAEAEAANLAKTRFLAAASHDLRQPLHALVLFAEALQSRPQEPDQQRLVDNIAAAVNSLDGLFSALLDLTRIDAGGVQARPCSFSVGDLWQRLRVHFEPVAFDKGLALNLLGGQHVVHADPVLVERIVRNLAANALRYTEDGGVLLAARRRGERVLLQVWDSGRGIALADQQRVFDEFVQVGEATRAAEPGPRRGLGLGLAIVKRLAGLMGTDIGLKSVPGRGSVFSLSLPLGAGQSAGHAAPQAVPLGQTLHQRHIVVVEPDADVRAELAAWLRSWGATVSTAHGLQALEGGATARPTADLLIAGLPAAGGIVGEGLARQIRALWGGNLPLILLGEPGAADAVASGARRLPKPVQPNRLRALIAFQLGEADTQNGSQADRQRG